MKCLFPALILSLVVLFPLRGQEETTYTHTGLDGIILAKTDTWYYEEFDTTGRPISGIRWEKKNIVERTTWAYFGESQQLRLSVTTTDTLETQTEYDRNGNIITIRETPVQKAEDKEPVEAVPEETRDPTSPKPEERVITYSYDGRNLLRETLTRKGDVLVKMRFDYRDDGTLSEKSVYKNGALTIRYVYRDEENWTETVYQDDLVVLTVTYENGERKRIQYETW